MKDVDIKGISKEKPVPRVVKPLDFDNKKLRLKDSDWPLGEFTLKRNKYKHWSHL